MLNFELLSDDELWHVGVLMSAATTKTKKEKMGENSNRTV
jgi:hypothetical protein